ncbi:MAG: hypothetical protein OQK48_01045 [Sulfurimonas sp.]|nr:hypothetical protein [Sulfurimonas sp.]
MKIDNYELKMHAEASQSTAISTTFIDTLEIENSNRTQEIRSIEEELEFTKRLQYDLLNQLMSLLNNRGSCNRLKSVKEMDLEQANIRTLSTRSLSIKEQYTSSQKLDVSMNGFVQSGNQKIKLDINLSFSSSFVQTHSIEKTMFYDPLVINFDAEMPDLDSKTFDFDIDMNGESDQISMLKKGNGFLALDKNDNGFIDDGYELFGTQNGNGFLDLKRYDKDNNSWIDENDAIFDKLRIWSKTQDEDTLVGIGEVGIGAIYLGYAEGSFDIRDETKTLGRIKSNGFYLNEDGSSGLMTQIDFAKHKKEATNNTAPLNELLQSS